MLITLHHSFIHSAVDICMKVIFSPTLRKPCHFPSLRVSQQSKTTLMTADNLSICFWPTLMRPDFENKDTLSTTKLNQSVIENFIQQCNYFFYGGEIIAPCGATGTSPPHAGHMGHAGHGMVESLLALQLPPPLQPQQIQHPLPSEPLI